jgi:iron complex outermembrane receptor protein
VSYSFVDATFRTSFLLPSPLNSGADANGNIQIETGDRLPGIPAHRVKLGADYRVASKWVIGGTLVYQSPQFFRGDESNQMAPLPGFAVLNLHSSYQATSHVELYLDLVNVTDARYPTFGVLGDPAGIGAPGVPPSGIGVDNRFESPAPPLSVFAGLVIRP